MSYNGRSYRVRIDDLTRDLPIFRVAPDVNIAIFNMLGDTEVVEAAARALSPRLPKSTEVLVVPEVKAVPLGQALSAVANIPYVVVRKTCKPYMADCVEAEVISITTGEPQTLFLDGKDRKLLQGASVALLDDVVSTGSTLRGLRQMMDEVDASVVAEVAVFTEGNADDWPDVIALDCLPVFSDDEAARAGNPTEM